MNERQRNRIGVFDSGVGGLTVLAEIDRQLPQESVLYFGDTARLPYGSRTPAEILQFVREILTWMQQESVKMAIMACNTSSALALEAVQPEFDFPILGIILPGARAAVEKGQRVGVIATEATVKSGAYYRAMLEIRPQVEVWQVACPEFVPLIEQNRLQESYTKEVARHYLQPLIDNRIDTLIYGCTHYPHLAPVFREILPRDTHLLNPARYVVAAAERELELLALKNTVKSRPHRFCVSGNPQHFSRLSRQWLGYLPDVERINLEKTTPLKPVSLNSGELI